MSYCFYCGKLLKDGEVCDCKAAQDAARAREQEEQTTSAPVFQMTEDETQGEPLYQGQPKSQNQAGYQGQPINQGQPIYQGQAGYQGQPVYQGQTGYQGGPVYQGQAGYQGQQVYQGQPSYQGQQVYQGQPSYQGQPGYQGGPVYQGQPGYQGQAPYQGQYRTQKMKAENPDLKPIVELCKGLIKTPADAVKKFVTDSRPMSVILLAIILTVISTVKELIYVIRINVRYSASGYGTYKAGAIFERLAGEFLTVAASMAILALILMVVINKIQKEQKVTYIQCLAIAVIGEVIAIPISFVANIIVIIPLKFFSYLATWMNAFGTAVSYILLFLGLKDLQTDENSMPLTYGLAAVLVAVGTTIIQLIV